MFRENCMSHILRKTFQVGRVDACEICPYFCTIQYNKDPETGKKTIHFQMNGESTSIFTLNQAEIKDNSGAIGG